ncbi:Peroxisome chaperone and import receptor [Entomortierella chlamydospora]|uniref:Peroxisome chaperone and import receptor n=1 Tax=Entomortierella chlamydospora TaxID=101097 RepID=A0A9P6N151_9FUNG|nr:Peroxisome chaperone and import receptor [Entomortierella chlamydospora]
MRTNLNRALGQNFVESVSGTKGALDGFTSSKPVPASTSTAPPPASSASSSSKAKSVDKSTKAAQDNDGDDNDDDDELDDDLGLDDEFTKSLASGMEELMKEMNGNPELKESFEEIFRGLDVNGKAPAATAAGADSKSFQDRIARTMDKLKDSSDQVEAQVAEESEEALMAEMMRQMEGMAEGGDFQNVLEGMMEQLMSKDILYEPMLDLKQKYPDWLANNKEKLSAEEYARYEKQYGYVKQIVEFFDRPDFDDKSDAQAKSIIDLMQGMQDCGQPPAEILGELAPGMELGPDGAPKMPDMPECNMQ